MTNTRRLWTTATQLLVVCSSQGVLLACSDTVAPEPIVADLLISPEAASVSGVGTSADDVHFGGVDVTRGVWGSSSTDIFAVGRSGRIWHYDGASWTQMDSGTEKFLFGVWGRSPSDVYAVGDEGIILHYDGSSWSPMESGTDRELWQIWGISSGDVFVVSRYGFVLRGVR